MELKAWRELGAGLQIWIYGGNTDAVCCDVVGTVVVVVDVVLVVDAAC